MFKALKGFLIDIPGANIALWIWKHKTILTVAALTVSLAFTQWRLDHADASLKKLKDEKAGLETVITEFENALAEMEGKVQYDKKSAEIAKQSAADVARGRQGGDGPMAPVLRVEYERVLDMAGKAKATNHDSR